MGDQVKRLAGISIAAAVLAVATGYTGASADDDCEKLVVYGYCGEHWRRSRLPVRFKLDASSIPGGVGLSSFNVSNAIASAVGEWERYWAVHGSGSTGGCLGGIDVQGLCYAGTANGAGYGRDGINSISFGDLNSSAQACSAGHAAAVAVACYWYEGSSGPKARRIDEVDIVLNRTNFCGDTGSPPRCWKVAIDQDELFGEIEGALAGSTLFSRDQWFDVQSVITHEVGHALGLTDIGNPSAPFPADLADAPRYTQTMYRWYYRRSTNKRSLDYGDVLGIGRVQVVTAQD